MKHAVSLSGGLGSWGAGMRVAERERSEDVLLVFTDTIIEDRDLYRFLIEGAAVILGRSPEDYAEPLAIVDRLPPVALGTIEERKRLLSEIRVRSVAIDDRLVWLSDGRTPMEVFFDERMLGGYFADPCSRSLKRRIVDRWRKENFEPDEVVTYVGLDWTEMHRVDGFKRALGEYEARSPLAEPPYVSKDELKEKARSVGVEPPRLYARGFSHNNCSGGCVKAGLGQWALLLRTDPDGYEYWEVWEQRFREEIRPDVAILQVSRRDAILSHFGISEEDVVRRRVEVEEERPKEEGLALGLDDERAAKTETIEGFFDEDGEFRELPGRVPITLRELRREIECGSLQPDLLDQGGCGCFVDNDEPADLRAS